ncbi:MAG: NifU family protein [Pseudomonadota bacterium]|nr:NifU family protein [Pseudomonadota bacterium]
MIRSSLKSGLKRVLGMGKPEAAPPPAAPAWRADAVTSAIPYPKQPPAPKAAPVAPAPVEAAPIEAAAPVEAAPVEAAPVEAAPVEAAPAQAPKAAVEPAAFAASPATQTDVVGAALTMEALQEIMDEMVRPALQGDGGDITLIKVENNDVYVKLVGSCSTCPSSIMTMKLGVEALLKEEFPSMGQLIQVD